MTKDRLARVLYSGAVGFLSGMFITPLPLALVVSTGIILFILFISEVYGE